MDTIVNPVTDVIQSRTVRDQSGLRPWVKGQSGNPAGRPKSVSIREVFQAQLTHAKAVTLFEHAYAMALGESAVAVRWAEFIVNTHSASPGLKITLEASGWDSFTTEVMRTLGYVNESPPAVSESSSDSST